MKNLFKLFIASLFILITTSSYAQSNLNKELPKDPNVLYGKLKNGMTYYIRHNETPKNRAELTLAVRSGSIQEDDDQQGLAHLCEHMAFNGTKNFPKHQLVDFLEKTGMKFGAEVNAYTIFDETVYGITVPLDSTKFMDKGLLVLHDWANFVSYDNKEIDAERKVVHEEWRMHQGAQFRMQDELFHAIFKNSKYADRNTIGLMSIVDSCDYETLKRFYKDWYRPDREAIMIVGDFDAKEIEKKVKKLFGEIKMPKNPRKYAQVDIPDNDKPIISIMTDKENPSTVVQMYIKQPKFYEKTLNDYRTSIMHRLYNGMINNRLKELTKNENPPFMFAASRYGDFIGPKDVYSGFAVTKEDGIITGLKTILEENYRVKQHGFTETELKREKNALMKKVEKLYNDRNKQKSQDFIEEYKDNFLLNQSPFPGIENEYNYYNAFINGIKTEEVNALAKKWITDKNMVILIMAPKKEGLKIPNKEDISTLIETVKNENLKPYFDEVSDKPLFDASKLIKQTGKVVKEEKIKEFDAEKWVLNNGITVILKPTDFKDDEIKMTCYSPGGWSVYGQKDDISAKLAANVTSESGLNDFTKIELDKKLSGKNVKVSPYIRQLTEGITGNSSTEDVETMFQLINLYFVKAQFDKTAFNSYISKQKAFYKNQGLRPESAFSDSIRAITSNYSNRKRPMTADILNEANDKRIFEIYKERFSDPSSFTFVFVGNIDLQKFKPLVEEYLGSLPDIKKEEKPKDINDDYPTGKYDIKAVKGKEDKSLVFMQFNHDFDDSLKDKVSLQALSKILSIDLINRIREELSIVYSIGAYPGTSEFPKPSISVTIYFPCAPANIKTATEETFKIFNKIKTSGPSEVNLNKAKQQLLKERETNLRKNEFWIKTMKDYFFYDIPLKEVNDTEEVIKSLTAKDIKNAADKFLKDDNYIRVSMVPEK